MKKKNTGWCDQWTHLEGDHTVWEEKMFHYLYEG